MKHYPRPFVFGGGTAWCPQGAHLLQSARDRLRDNGQVHRGERDREAGTHRGMDRRQPRK